MDKHDSGPPPAFPSHGSMGEVAQTGMTLRDYFAAKAMAAIVSSDVWNVEAAGDEPAQPHHVATEAYALADAMLRARDA